MIELRSLAYFVAACRSESFALAAERLGIALSTLSATMKALEQNLGVSLFRRINNTLCPTPAARALMRAADPLLMAELFARHWAAASRATMQLLTVDIGLSFTIGGVSRALRETVDEMSRRRPNVLVDCSWADEKDIPHFDGPARSWTELKRDHIVIALGQPDHRSSGRATILASDRWVFACRLPAGTKSRPGAAELAAGHLIVPALAPVLIEQADRYFSQHKIRGVRFLNEHPGDLPRLIDDYPEATLFVPETLLSPRLGLLNVTAVAPERPLTTEIVAREPASTATTALFIRQLKASLARKADFPIERPLLSLRQIHYFNMVHRVRRVSAAARGANVSQPALSEQLHKLEESLGGRLFERHGDGVIPTDRGARFAVMARLIEAGFGRLATSSADAAPPQSRRITAGILPSVNQHGFLVNRITEALIDVQARHPTLKLVIREAPNGALQDWVMRGLVGVAIVETALPHMPRLPLGSSEGLAAVVHSKHRLLAPGPVTFADLLQRKLVLPTSRFGLRALLEMAAEERGLRIQPHMEIDALPMAVAVLARLPVCTVLPPSAVEREVASGDLVAHPIIEPAVSRQLFVIYSGERSLSGPERELVNSLRKKLSEPRTA